jgi:hypothetical protein
MDMIYERICKFNGHPIPLSDIHTLDLDDKITTLISSLYLANSRKIDIWQRKFPYGQIMVKNRVTAKDELEDALDDMDGITIEPLTTQKSMIFQGYSGVNASAESDAVKIDDISEDSDTEEDDRILLAEVGFNDDDEKIELNSKENPTGKIIPNQKNISM